MKCFFPSALIVSAVCCCVGEDLPLRAAAYQCVTGQHDCCPGVCWDGRSQTSIVCGSHDQSRSRRKPDRSLQPHIALGKVQHD